MAARRTPRARRTTGRRAAKPRRKARAATKPRRKPSRKAGSRARSRARPARKRPARTTRSSRARRRVTAARARRATGRRPARARTRTSPKRLPSARRQPTRPPATAKPVARTATPSRPKPPTVAERAHAATWRRPAPPPDLSRQRRRLPDEERLDVHEPASVEPLGDERQLLSARTGHDELNQRLKLHTEASPEITAGDVDARWEDAYATGDETPGGDNPTPDQDRVDEIGKALGINYADDQELQGGQEVTDRDRRRWELDPASSEDWPHDRRKK